MLVFDGQVLGEDVVGSPDDKFIDQSEQLCQAFVTLLLIGIGTRCISAAKDRELVFLTELIFRPQIVRVCKVEEGKVLGQIVLDGCSRKNDTLLHVQTI